MSDIIDVTAAILIKERKVLIVRRPANDQLAGYWEFLGGKFEPGESPEEYLARKVREEFCINVEIVRSPGGVQQGGGACPVGDDTQSIKTLSGYGSSAAPQCFINEV